MRINKFLSQAGLCSRREADRLLKEGRVTINGKTALLGDQVSAKDRVEVDGKLLEEKNKEEFVLIAYNKPVGVECTTARDVPDNIIDAVNYPERVYPVGRLDKNSEGLIFLTNNGEIVNRLLRRSYGHEKEYWIRANRDIRDKDAKEMAKGVDIGEEHATLPCKVVKKSARTLVITLVEGRKRQIRRMLQAYEYRVEKLKRIRIMHIKLDGIKTGEYRLVKGSELSRFLSALGLD